MGLLTISGLSYSYHSLGGETKALSNINIEVKQGEFLAVVGPSGCGKSTLLHLIAGLLTPGEGSIEIEGKPVEENRKRIGYMLQRDHLLEWRTTYENVLLGLEINHMVNEQTKRRVEEMLSTYGLARFRNAYPRELSGGMRQRAALIRTLVLEPELLLLDEPFSALDYQTRLNAANDICGILRKEKKTAVLITHDIAEAVSIADRVLVFTKRPGGIRKEIIITLTMPDGSKPKSPLSARRSVEFSDFYHLIWRELMEGETMEPEEENGQTEGAETTGDTENVKGNQ